MRIAMLGIGALCIAAPVSAQATRGSATHFQVATTLVGAGTLPNQVTLGLPNLVGNLPRGSVSLKLQMVTVAWGSSAQVWVNGASNLQLAGDSGKVRVRYNFAFQSGGATSSATVLLHGGQLASDPVVGQCTVTPSSPHCDSVVDAMSPWFLTATIGGSASLIFVNATVAPTP